LRDQTMSRYQAMDTDDSGSRPRDQTTIHVDDDDDGDDDDAGDGDDTML